MRIELHGVEQCAADLERLARNVRRAEGEGLSDAAETVGEAFRHRARRLSGAHADSYRTEPARTTGDRTTVRGGPTMAYSRKISLRFGDLADAVRHAGPRAVRDGVARSYNEVVR